MRRLSLLVLVPIAAFFACDPKLDIQTTPGDGGTEGGGGPIVNPPPPPSSGDDAGGDDGGTGDDGGGTDSGMQRPIPTSPSDFASGEKFTTTSAGSGYSGYAAWDAKNVYLAIDGSDVGSNAGDKWVLVYLGSPGVTGTTTGLAYNCGGACNAPAQQASLPFPASHHLRWKVDNSYANVQQWTGSAWTDDSLVPMTIKHNGNFVSMTVSRASLGNPTKLDVHMTMLIEEPPMASNGGWTYSGVPSTSFTDGYNPTPYAHYYEFDLGDLATAPNTYAPK